MRVEVLTLWVLSIILQLLPDLAAGDDWLAKPDPVTAAAAQTALLGTATRRLQSPHTLTTTTSTSGTITTELDQQAGHQNATDNSTNSTSFTTTTTVLVAAVPTFQKTTCSIIRPLLGIWYVSCLLTSTTILLVVIKGLRDVGAIFAIPSLAGLRYNLFATLWAQVLLQVIQALRDDDGDGCYIPEPYLIAGQVPMHIGVLRAEPLPRHFTDFAFFMDHALSGQLVLLLLLAMPRKRLRLCPVDWLAKHPPLRRCTALPALLLLLVVNPVLALAIVKVDLTFSILVELGMFSLGFLLAWVAARQERMLLVHLFDHLYLQEWSVLAAALFTRWGKLAIALYFHRATARFLIAFVSSISGLSVLIHLLVCTAPWKDPLIWLAGQDWVLDASTQSNKQELGRGRRGRAVLRFILSWFGCTDVLTLVLQPELEWCKIHVPTWCRTLALYWPWHEAPEELDRGQLACAEWVRWAEKVCSLWPGLKDKGTCTELTGVEPPTGLTPHERELKRAGQLTRRASWGIVCGDLFSDRVHSQEIPVICTVIILSYQGTWSFLTNNIGLIDLEPTLSLLLQSLAFCLVIWLVLSLLLIGNNVFLPLCFPGHTGRRCWLLAVCLLTSILGLRSVFDMQLATEGRLQTWFPSPIQACWSFMHFTLSVALFSTALRQICMDHAPQVRNTYHKLEFASQRYCQKLLEGELSGSARMAAMGVKGVGRDQIFQVRCGSSWRPCRVVEVEGNGTCAVVLQGGQEISDVPFKDLAPLHIESRVAAQDMAAQREIMKVLTPAVEVVRSQANRFTKSVALDVLSGTATLPQRVGRGASSLAEATLHSLSSIRSSSPSALDRSSSLLAAAAAGRDSLFAEIRNSCTAVPHGEAARSSCTAVPHGEAARRHTSRSTFKEFKSECGAAIDKVTRSFGEKVANDAIVTVACDEGKSRAQYIQRQRMQAQGFRMFFNSSVGVSGLMLTAMLVGAMLVILSCIILARRTTELEQGVARLRTFAFYSLRVQTQGFDYGACNPPTEAELVTCRRAAGKEACGSSADLLLWSFDADGSTLLEPAEMATMSLMLSGLSVSSAAGGRQKVSLTATEFRELAEQARPNSLDSLDTNGLATFSCLTSRKIAELRRTATDTMQDFQQSSSSSMFMLADRSPQDGFLTEAELLGLVPGAMLEVYPSLADSMGLYTLAVRIGFTLGDTNPMDGRLSRAEADVALAYSRRLMTDLPKLSKQLEQVRSGERTSFDTALVISVLDVNGDGTASRAEIGLLATALSTATGNSQVASQVLPLFDMVDQDGDGELHPADVDVLLQRLAGMLAIAQVLAAQDGAAVDVQALKRVLDVDQNGAISRAEFDRLLTFLPPQHASQAAFLSSLLFSQADTSPADGQLNDKELATAVQRVQALVSRLAEAPSRRLGSQPLERRVEEDKTADVLENGYEALVPVATYSFSTLFKGFQPMFDEYIKGFLKVFTSEILAIVMPLVILGMRVAIVVGAAGSVLMMIRTKQEHERLTQRMQMGDHAYAGSTQKRVLRNSFSVSTSFPGIFAATLVINFFATALMAFISLILVITPIVLFFIPETQDIILDLLLVLRFPVLVALARYLLKVMVVDWLLVEHGQPIYPYFFAPLWLTLILVNFVQAPFLAVFRWVSLVLHASVSATYLHTSPFPESLITFDPGYYAFLSLTFTQSSRRNLVRTCFISALMPQAHRARGPKPCSKTSSGLDADDPAQRKRRLQMRNRLWVAVTLWNNPSLRQYRRLSREREVDSLTALWDKDAEDSPQAVDEDHESGQGTVSKDPESGQGAVREDQIVLEDLEVVDRGLDVDSDDAAGKTNQEPAGLAGLRGLSGVRALASRWVQSRVADCCEPALPRSDKWHTSSHASLCTCWP